MAPVGWRGVGSGGDGVTVVFISQINHPGTTVFVAYQRERRFRGNAFRVVVGASAGRDDADRLPEGVKPSRAEQDQAQLAAKSFVDLWGPPAPRRRLSCVRATQRSGS